MGNRIVKECKLCALSVKRVKGDGSRRLSQEGPHDRARIRYYTSMRRRHDWLATAVLVLLLTTLPVLAVLQYRVLTAAAEGEIASLRRVAATAARQIRTEVGLEVAGLSSLVVSEIDTDSVSRTDPDLLAVWRRETRFPELLDDIVIVQRIADRTQVFRYDRRAERVEPLSQAADARAPGSWSFVAPVPTGSVLIRIDSDALVRTVVPLLVEETLGLTISGFQATLVDHSAREVLYSTTPVAYERVAADGAMQAEEIIPFGPMTGALDVPFGERPGRFSPGLIQQWLSLRRWDDDPHRGERPRVPESGIALHIWHAAGSVERAAFAERNRNFALSSGVMLAFAGVGVLFHRLLRRSIRQREREREFVATITHELRTPVAAIHATAENLAAGIITRPDRVAEYGRVLLDEGRRLRRMVDQTLFYAGLEGGGHRSPSEPVDWESLLSRSIAAVKGLDPAQLTVRVDVNLPGYRGDLIAIESVVTNLLSNAAKHNPPGTPIWVDVSSASPSSPVCVQVRDAGVGIPRREVRRVREPFYRGRRSRLNQVPGTGVGLNLVGRIVDAYRGTFEIHSVDGEGTTVTVELPLDQAP